MNNTYDLTRQQPSSNGLLLSSQEVRLQLQNRLADVLEKLNKKEVKIDPHDRYPTSTAFKSLAEFTCGFPDLADLAYLAIKQYSELCDSLQKIASGAEESKEKPAEVEELKREVKKLKETLKGKEWPAGSRSNQSILMTELKVVHGTEIVPLMDREGFKALVRQAENCWSSEERDDALSMALFWKTFLPQLGESIARIELLAQVAPGKGLGESYRKLDKGRIQEALDKMVGPAGGVWYLTQTFYYDKRKKVHSSDDVYQVVEVISQGLSEALARLRDEGESVYDDYFARFQKEPPTMPPWLVNMFVQPVPNLFNGTKIEERVVAMFTLAALWNYFEEYGYGYF